MKHWKTIDNAPEDGVPHVRGMWIKSHGKNFWLAECGIVNDEGQWVDLNGDDDQGFELDEYTHWCELPFDLPETPK